MDSVNVKCAFQFWISFNRGKYRRYIYIHSFSSNCYQWGS